MGFLQVSDQNWNNICLEYSCKLLAMFLAGHPNHQLVFMRLWKIEPTYQAYVAQDLKISENLLEIWPFTFALEVALASCREYLNLDKWLADNVSAHGAVFLHSMIVLLEVKMESEKVSRKSDLAMDNHTMPLNPQTIAILLCTLCKK
ncbi:hypothetical protein BDN67DRAFT_992254 [Paxillus ammoniavirescens]|nr:hypothetical protein BDN67DRAFT_992254 [Paxillus ammoniavirescens]